MIDAQGHRKDVPYLLLGSVYGNLPAMSGDKFSYPVAYFLYTNEVRGVGDC